MFNENPKFNLDTLLRILSDEIDVGKTKYEEAEKRYKSVGSWLNAPDSPLHQYNPEIFVQGSFSLGTATKPYGEEGEFDIDAICALRNTIIPGNSNANSNQRQWLKKVVGDRLKTSKIYGSMIEPKEGRRRCWTLKYADSSKFHMDICPSIPEDIERIRTAGIDVSDPDQVSNYILLTDNKNWDMWIHGNPRGYRAWFMTQMQERLTEQRAKIAASRLTKVEEVPEYEARTTLQRSIQILKRHRDIKYEDDDDAPISIIITTSAAKAYDNDPDLFSALQTIVNEMRNQIQVIDGQYYILNPVDHRENFADKWEITPRKKDIFFDWLDSVEALLEDLKNLEKKDDFNRVLKEAFGTRDGSKTVDVFITKLNPIEEYLIKSESGKTVYPLVPVPKADHAKTPKWENASTNHSATIRCVTPKWQGFRRGRPIKSDQPLRKDLNLNFDVSTTVPGPYEVYWQVTNIGFEAFNDNCPRGDFYESSLTLGKRKRSEKTSYTGRHWVKVFIVKNGLTYAESEPFIALCVRVVVASIEQKSLQFDRAIERLH
ncbi:nucleotidyltransferase, partial [Desulfobacula sp.]|uniref:nucleotidyltransferase n=1 Tax=Desulfobacula sp. TaxID=2593537 RepID=UPI001D8343F3|nr:nucleotidyltransferase [Desulfobacula sp.]